MSSDSCYEFHYGNDTNFQRVKLEDSVDFSDFDHAFETSPIYTARIENGVEQSTTYVAKIDENDESAGYSFFFSVGIKNYGAITK